MNNPLQTFGNMGKGERVLGGGGEATLFEHDGTGCLTHFYFGGSDKPTMLSSGLEDYFLGAYYFDTGRFYSDTAGLTHFDKENMRFSAYRFHDDDPLFFTDGLRLTCRNGETEHGQANEQAAYLDPPPTRFTTYCWVYQW